MFASLGGKDVDRLPSASTCYNMLKVGCGSRDALVVVQALWPSTFTHTTCSRLAAIVAQACSVEWATCVTRARPRRHASSSREGLLLGAAEARRAALDAAKARTPSPPPPRRRPASAQLPNYRRASTLKAKLVYSISSGAGAGQGGAAGVPVEADVRVGARTCACMYICGCSC